MLGLTYLLVAEGAFGLGFEAVFLLDHHEGLPLQLLLVGGAGVGVLPPLLGPVLRSSFPPSLNGNSSATLTNTALRNNILTSLWYF